MGIAMFEKEECLAYYRRLTERLEEDYCEISACVQGEIETAYRQLLSREIDSVKEHLNALLRI